MIEATEGRPPPTDLDAEAAVLSAVMIAGDGSPLDIIGDRLKPEHFYAEAHRKIYEAALALHASGKPSDIVQIGTRLKDRGLIGGVGGMAYLTEILNAAPAVVNVGSYAATVLEKARARKFIALCQRAAASGYLQVSPTEAKRLREDTEAALFALVHEESEEKHLEHVGPITAEVYEEIQKQHESGERVTGITTGFVELDDHTGGLHGSELTIVGARPGAGKTSYMMSLACSAAEAGEATAVFSLEMPKGQIVKRALAARGQVNVKAMRTAGLTPADWGRLQEACRTTHKLPLYVDDSAGLTLGAMRAKLRKLDRELKRRTGNGVRLVCVDYLQLMCAEAASREQEISALARGLKNLSREMHVPVVALSQLSRSLESRSDKRPMMQDLRESGAIEQDADNIHFLYRDDYYNPKSERRGIVEVNIAKQRNGPTEKVLLKFDAWCTAFRDLTNEERDQVDYVPQRSGPGRAHG